MPRLRTSRVSLAAVVIAACTSPSPESDGHAALRAPPVDASRGGSLEAVTSWRHRESLVVDLNGDGRSERLVLASDVTIGDGGEPLWEDGHRWGAYVEDSSTRTLLYSAFLPHGVAEVAVGLPAAALGAREVLIVERTPHHSRALVVAYEGVGVARLVSDANYSLERWLPSLTTARPRGVAADTIVPQRFAAPWSRDTLTAAQVPSVYIREWRAAANQSTCGLIAPRETRVANAQPRRSNFTGGWAVAYDTPDQRSAFGVAGTGTSPGEGTFDRWPKYRQWSDGSSVGWGPEGGTGPNQLAYLRIQGQGCLYNVWSRISEEHLAYLLHQLRFVRAPTSD